MLWPESSYLKGYQAYFPASPSSPPPPPPSPPQANQKTQKKLRKKFLIFQNFFGFNVKKILIFSQKKTFILPEIIKNPLYFQKQNFLALILKKSEKSSSYVFSNETLHFSPQAKKIRYSRRQKFLMFQEMETLKNLCFLKRKRWEMETLEKFLIFFMFLKKIKFILPNILDENIFHQNILHQNHQRKFLYQYYYNVTPLKLLGDNIFSLI